MELATFAAGCFWGVQAAFSGLPGVVDTKVGYTGGTKPNPTYEEVCSGMTGHAEAVRIKYDPKKIKYEDLLKVFWEIHDPTQVNRQGPDIGYQYRSVIFYHTPQQKTAAQKAIQALNESKRFKKPIATQIEAAKTFWEAEEYHQKYLEKRGLAGCH